MKTLVTLQRKRLPASGLKKNFNEQVRNGNLGMASQKPSRGVIRKSVLKIDSKFTGEHPCRRVTSQVGIGVLL